MTSERPSTPPPFVELALTAGERAQIEEQLAAAFGVAPAAARAWVEVTARRGVCYGRVVAAETTGSVGAGARVVASFAADELTLVRGAERLSAAMLQSCYVHPDFRGLGYGLERSDVEALRRRFAADVLLLTLFDDGLVQYWRRRGFEVVQASEVVELSEFLARTRRAFAPALSDGAIADKLAEVAADGANAVDDGALILVRRPDDPVVDEVIVRPAGRVGWAPVAAVRAGEPALHVRLKTVMASPGGLELVCALDL